MNQVFVLKHFETTASVFYFSVENLFWITSGEPQYN